MRTNLPITNVETLLPEGEFIYSRTDLKGILVEVNDAFANVSAYPREEMLGQPHNLVRHPDMPPEAFADMWKSLKAGLPWRALVKNRRKDGGFYWVIANASPVREDGQIVGYQSVRGRPTREEIQVAEAIYQRLKKGDKSIRIEQGHVIPAKPSPLVFLHSLAFQTALAGILLLLMGAALFVSICAPGALPSLVFWILGGLGVLAGLNFLLLFRPRLFRDLDSVTCYLDDLLSSGDLRSRLTRERPDRLGDIMHRLDRLTAWIQATLQGMGDASLAVLNSADVVGQSVVKLNDSAQVQSSATAAAAAGIEEITASIGGVASNAGETRDAAKVASEASNNGVKLADLACETILKLAETVKTSAAQVERLSSQSDEISRITGTIKEIADQTNLLALNAAIEAARAGEQGRGFAVVADEVRKLAERSAGATEEISKMIDTVQEETANAVGGMRSGAEQVENGVKLVQDAKNALQEINAQMSKTLMMVSDISHSSDEQQAAMTVMAQSVEQVASMTDQNLDLAGETTRTSETLRAVTDRMQKAVGQYKV
ncbi:methyl-accepting chemotaxis protein [Betaproteobacteria bacterium]|nr:methyl-accepting chemotaxis protein [Betaproteobacteria bacterium]